MKWYKITVPLSVGGATRSAAGGSSKQKTAEENNAGMKRPGETSKSTPANPPEAKQPETVDKVVFHGLCEGR